MKEAARDADRHSATVVVARSAEGNTELTAALRRLGVRLIPVETIEFLELSDWSEVDGALRSLDRYDWIALTSVRGAGAFAARIRRLSIGREKLPKIAAVGENTAGSLGRAGFRVDFVPSEYTTACLGRELPRDAGGRVLLLRADTASDELERELKRRRFATTSVPIYRAQVVRAPYRDAAVGRAAAVVFGSPLEVEGLRRRLNFSAFSKLTANAVAACIGPVTAREARRVGFRRVEFPNLHTFDELLMVVRRLVMR